MADERSARELLAEPRPIAGGELVMPPIYGWGILDGEPVDEGTGT